MSGMSSDSSALVETSPTLVRGNDGGRALRACARKLGSARRRAAALEEISLDERFGCFLDAGVIPASKGIERALALS